jgi:hypothetical protein
MKFRFPALILLVLVIIGLAAFSWIPTVEGSSLPQMPTSNIPTVTGTPIGAMITVTIDQEQINVRSGPSRLYPAVGVLLAEQSAAAKGRSAGGDWILIDYPGAEGGMAWVYAPLVILSPGSVLPIVEPPPTPTPLYTTTIDPTLAAQYVYTLVPTRMATFTPAPPLKIPTYAPASSLIGQGGLPTGLVIVILFSLGILIGLFSLVQNR